MADAQIKALSSEVAKLQAKNKVLSVYGGGSGGGVMDSILRNYSKNYIRRGR